MADLLLTGATAGALLFGGLTGPSLTVVIAFGSAVLLYLVTEELLAEAHEAETPGTTSMLFADFLLLFVIDVFRERVRRPASNGHDELTSDRAGPSSETDRDALQRQFPKFSIHIAIGSRAIVLCSYNAFPVGCPSEE